MDVGGYDFGMAMIIASVAVDIRVAQLVDKPAVGMEVCILFSVCPSFCCKIAHDTVAHRRTAAFLA